MATIKDDLKSFRRSWVHHTGMQLATLSVLASTFSVVTFGLSLGMNLKRVLASWGDGVQISVYLNEDVSEERTKELEAELDGWDEIKEISFVPSETATANFKSQMASYAPDLLADADFTNPFPASFKLALNGSVESDQDVEKLQALAAKIEKLDGVEDVSYGQSWVRNYSSVVSTLYAAAGILAIILVAGSLFVVGNSIRAAISARRDEIEILELVGATSQMIRRPFVVEGLMMGFLAAATALALNFGLHLWQKSVMSSSLVLARIAPLMAYLSPTSVLAFALGGAIIGGLGAWLTVRRINDGWSASQGLEA